jgi:hypothetical protein
MAVSEYLASFGFKVASNAAVRWIERLWRERVRQEHVVYDGRQSIYPGDVTGRGSVRYDSQGQPFGNRGEGHCNVIGGVIDITRTNIVGRYEVCLERLRSGRDIVQTLEPTPGQSRRVLTFSFQAKVQGGNHSLVTVVFNPDSGAWLGFEARPVNSSDWRSHSFAILFDPTKPARIRFDDQDVAALGSLQIRRLLLIERLG